MAKALKRQILLWASWSSSPSLSTSQGDLDPTVDFNDGSAAKKVFAIPELFENILTSLDQRTLLAKALRICRQWNEFIAGSSAIQQHLFFEPRDDPSSRVMNPVLRELFPVWFPTAEEQVGPKGASFDSEELKKWLPKVWRGKIKAMTYEHASWRKMLPCQPPPYRVLRCTCHRLRQSDNELTTLTQPESLEIYPGEPEKKDGDYLEYEYKDEEVQPEFPITMHKLYNLVILATRSGGSSVSGHFMWNEESADLTEYVGADIHGDCKEIFENALKRDGLVFFEWPAYSCRFPAGPHPFYGSGLYLEGEDHCDAYNPNDCVEGEPYGYRLRAWHMGYWAPERGPHFDAGEKLRSRISST